MPARIIVVHDDHALLEPLATAMRADGHDVAAFDQSITAWDALTPDCRFDMLITRVRFPTGPHGVALARLAHMNRREIHVLFVAAPEMEQYTDGLGMLVATPTCTSKIAEAAARMLTCHVEVII